MVFVHHFKKKCATLLSSWLVNTACVESDVCLVYGQDPDKMGPEGSMGPEEL